LGSLIHFEKTREGGARTAGVSTGRWRVLWPVLFAAIVVYLLYLRATYARQVQLDTLDDLRVAGSVLAVATSVVTTLRVLLEHTSATVASHSSGWE
jgi:hypothetical protein